MPDPSFKDFVLDQLAGLPEVRAKSMFGGYGLYQGEHFFGILGEGRLYLRTDPHLRVEYEKRGAEPFTFERDGKRMEMQYHEVFPEALENRMELERWAWRSIEVARQAQSISPKKTKPESTKAKRPGQQA